MEKPRGSPLSATGALFLVGLGAKATGFLRVAAVGLVLGAGVQGDAFLTAFLLPEVLHVWFTEGGLTGALVRVLVLHPGPAAARGLLVAALVAGLLGLAMVAWGAAGLVATLVPGFDPATRSLAAGYLAMAAGYFPLALVYFALQATANAEGRFWAPALGPLLFNVCMLHAAARTDPGSAGPMVAAIVVGGLVQAAVALPSAWSRLRGTGDPAADGDPGESGEALREALRLAFPTMLIAGCMQLQFLAERGLLSSLPTGTITRYATAQKLALLPMGLLAVPLATGLMPYLARRVAESGPKAAARGVRSGVLCLVGTMGPATVLLHALAGPIVGMLLGRGELAPLDLQESARLVAVAAPAALGTASGLILARGFLAAGDALTPALAKGVATVLILVLDAALVGELGPSALFAVAGVVGGLEALFLLAWLPGGRRAETQATLVRLARLALPQLAMLAAVLAFGPEAAEAATPGARGQALSAAGLGLAAYGLATWVAAAPWPWTLLGWLRRPWEDPEQGPTAGR